MRSPTSPHTQGILSRSREKDRSPETESTVKAEVDEDIKGSPGDGELYSYSYTESVISACGVSNGSSPATGNGPHAYMCTWVVCCFLIGEEI